jgi:hypothetical protein
MYAPNAEPIWTSCGKNPFTWKAVFGHMRDSELAGDQTSLQNELAPTLLNLTKETLAKMNQDQAEAGSPRREKLRFWSKFYICPKEFPELILALLLHRRLHQVVRGILISIWRQKMATVRMRDHRMSDDQRKQMIYKFIKFRIRVSVHLEA